MRIGTRRVRMASVSARWAISFFIVTAESGSAAADEAERAYSAWLKSFNHLYALHGRGPMLGAQPGSFADAEQAGPRSSRHAGAAWPNFSAAPSKNQA